MLASKIFRSVTVHRTAVVKLLNRSSSSATHHFHQNGNSTSNILPFLPNPQIKEIMFPMVGLRVFKEPPVNFVINRILPSTMILPMGWPLESSLPLEEKQEKKIEKQCARLIKIRKRKMRIHKRKKWLKKMKCVLARIKLRRKQAKAKAFEEEIFAPIDTAGVFNAEEWVGEMVIKSHTDPETLKARFVKPPRPTVYVFPASNKRR